MGRETALGLQIQHGVLAMEMEYRNGEDERQYILEHLGNLAARTYTYLLIPLKLMIISLISLPLTC